jgi:hypothetical protein
MASVMAMFLAATCSMAMGHAFTPASTASTQGKHLGGRKTVTVYTDSEAAAFAEANRKNPGWSAVSAKKTGGGKAYQVTMTKD